MNDKISIDELAKRAEAFLFSEGGEMTTKKLCSLLECQESELAVALAKLTELLQGSGLTLIQTGTAVSLAVSKEVSPTVEAALKRDLGRDIGEAGLEVLAIVLYRGPSTRARIDYIRGVNTSSTLRNLLARALLEREANPDDAREYLYRPTVELLAHLGVKDVKDLPEYATILEKLMAFEKQSEPFSNNATESTNEPTSAL